MATTTAKVKSVLSGDTLIFDNGTQLSLAYVSAPRFQTEPFGFAAREALRTLLVGKTVKYRVWYDINGRNYGDALAPVFSSLIEYCLEKGTVKLRDGVQSKVEFPELYDKFKAAQDKAEAEKIGIWAEEITTPDVLQVVSDEFLKTPYNSIVERVISGDRVQLRAIVDDNTHILTNAILAGIRTPRSSSPGANDGEEFGDEAKLFTESRLLQRNVKATFFGTAANGLPVVELIHPNGNVALFLLEAGLSFVSDWQSTILGSSRMQILRLAEKKARNAHLKVWKDVTVSTSGTGKYHATVFRVISPDTIELLKPDDTLETVQLSSVRAPRKNDDKNISAYVPTAKEFTRKLLVGKKVKVVVDSIRPESAMFESRPLVTLSLEQNDKDVAETLISAGYATAVRHRRDDLDARSPNWDRLMELEQEATEAERGIHSTKPAPIIRTVDASDSQAKANTYINNLSRSVHPLSGVVEHISSAGRLRIYIPKMDIILTLVLLGLRVVKAGEPFSNEALAHVQRAFTQRDVKFTVSTVDKTGAFAGLLYFPNDDKKLLNIELVELGFAAIHEPSLRNVHGTWVSQVEKAEEAAKDAGVGIWKDYRAKQEAEKKAADKTAKELAQLSVSDNKSAAPVMKYIDIKVSDVSRKGDLSYRRSSDEAKFTKLSSELTTFYTAPSNAPKTKFVKPPRKNDLVVATVGGKQFRGRVIVFDKATQTHTVQLIDTGKFIKTSEANLKPLVSQFGITTIPALANTVVLSFIRLPASSPTDYLSEYVDELKRLVENQRVVANVDSPSTVEPANVTIFGADSRGADDSINSYLIEEGYAYLKTKLAAWEKADAFKGKREHLKKLCDLAQQDRIGVWEYGYSAEDEE